MQSTNSSKSEPPNNGYTHPRHLDKVFLEGKPAGDGQINETLRQRNKSAASRIYSNLASGQMRLLKLHHGTGRLRCSVIVATDCNHLAYEALSYVWGSEHHPKKLQLNNHCYYITQNLDKALRGLRSRDRDRILWVDALVINQSDLSERENEVRRMSDRFSGATRTIAWIGHADSWVEQFLNFLNGTSLDRIRSLSRDTAFVVQYMLVCDLPYWSRAWIVQEIMFSKAVLLMYGSVTVPFDKLAAVEDGNTITLHLDPKDPTIGNTQLQVRPGAGLRHEWLRFPSWLKTCSTKRLCKEPLDRILAYRNCFPPVARDLITVDYIHSEYDSAREIILAWIASEKNVDFLKHVGAREPWPSDISMPTWLPHFFGKETLGVGLESTSGGLGLNSACPEPPKLLEDDCILQVLGFWLGDVDCIQDNVGKFEERDTAVDTLLQHCCGSLDALGKHTAEHIHATYNEDSLLAMARTVPEAQENLKIYFERKSKDRVFLVTQLWNIITKGWRTSLRFRPCAFSCLDATSLAFGLGSADIKIDDRLCLIMGCSVPLVLRRNGERYTVVGNILTPFAMDLVNNKEFENLWRCRLESIELS